MYRATGLGFLILLLLAPMASAQTVTMEEIVVGSAGGRATGGSYTMDLTIGEPVLGSVAGNNFNADYGFWWMVRTSVVAVGETPLPLKYALAPNRPNPFFSQTVITFAIPQKQQGPVFLGVYNVQGALVRTLVNGTKDPGVYAVTWNSNTDAGIPVSAGVYFVKFQAGSFRQTHKIVVLK